MIEYNFAAEIASFVIIVILIINLFYEKELDSRRNRFFKGIVCAIFFIVIFTITSTYMTLNYTHFPVWLMKFAMTMYFITLPLALFMGMLYVRSLKRTKNSKANWSASRLLLILPYVVYVCIILSNLVLGNVFTITKEFGYERALLYQLPYPVAFFYVILIFVLAVKNRKETNRGIGFIICLNVLVMGAISSLQLIYPDLILAGLANVAGVLVMYLYVQNVTKSKDNLTGLYNRERLTYNVNKRMNLYFGKIPSMHRHTSYEFSLVLYSLRNLKGINERYGLSGGNELLEEVAKYLRASFAPFQVYRYGGDEFAIMIDRPVNDLDNLLYTASLRFDKPFYCDENKISMNINVVYARVDFPDFGRGVRSLISALDYSVSSLKHGKLSTNYMHDLTICDKMSRRNSVIDRIKHAVENDGFEMYYQAIYSTEENKFVGSEALIRMKGSLGSVYPDEFIPLAEETGLIVSMTYIVIEKVCKDLRRCMNAESEVSGKHFVSINFPYAQFLEPDIVNKIMRILDQYDISPSQIKIEITERTLIGDSGLIIGIMREMQEKGFMFEVDDFGVDYSNISIILHLPVDLIKIDRSLVHLATGKDSYEEFFRLFLKAIKHTGRKVVIEGVETQEQADFFKSCKSDFIQGFFYAVPAPFDDYLTVLKSM